MMMPWKLHYLPNEKSAESLNTTCIMMMHPRNAQHIGYSALAHVKYMEHIMIMAVWTIER